MTAVATPSNLQPLPRWNSSNGTEGLDSMSAEEVSRMFMPRKSVQRQNSASSTSSSSSSSSTFTIPVPLPQTNGDALITNGDQAAYPRKKAHAKGLWPSTKAEPVSGLSTARPHALATPSGQSAASTMSTSMHQPSSVHPSQTRSQSQPQQNGVRNDTSAGQTDYPAVLALLPMTGTFERKQINVPFLPDMLKIGRQTNAKTIPTVTNGFFDSKVLSRQHAEVWAERETGKIWIRDVKSSNGTFVNGTRLSPENRDSEPHELHADDTLELGIDIVSEDQKSIVHHKVSAKVEFAGLFSSDLSMLRLDPGIPMMGDPVSQQISQMRGRGGSQGSIGSNGRISGHPNLAGNNANMLAPQRQMNLWMGPITVEQVVKKLTTELKQAKHQSQDLHRTKDFFNTLMTLEPGEEPPKSPPKMVTEDKQTNGIHQPTQFDPISSFSQPPAPPPQQPLPEKPDTGRFSIPESLYQPAFRRAETEKRRSPMTSPTRPEPSSGQIVSLLDALKSAKQEIDSQGDRIKYLDVQLDQERKARELAEKRAHALSGGRLPQENHETNGAVDAEAGDETPLDSLELADQDLPDGIPENGEVEDSISNSEASISANKDTEQTRQKTADIDASTSRLQARLDLMVKEMDGMKTLMQSYKHRAEDAEEGRRSLMEMVENIRAGRVPSAVTTASDDPTSLSKGNASKLEGSEDLTVTSVPAERQSPSSEQRQLPNGAAVTETVQRELEKTLATVLHQQRDGPDGGGRIAHSAPYVSMVGVVLVGVGIMTWLNGWQPGGEKR